jgi:hypothetical protein
MIRKMGTASVSPSLLLIVRCDPAGLGYYQLSPYEFRVGWRNGLA